MSPTFKIPNNVLRALILNVPKRDPREALRGIHVILADPKAVRLEATDGRTVLQVDLKTETEKQNDESPWIIHVDSPFRSFVRGLQKDGSASIALDSQRIVGESKNGAETSLGFEFATFHAFPQSVSSILSPSSPTAVTCMRFDPWLMETICKTLQQLEAANRNFGRYVLGAHGVTWNFYGNEHIMTIRGERDEFSFSLGIMSMKASLPEEPSS